MPENYKEILSFIAIILTFLAFVPYIIKSILSGVTKPHVFSWVIWGITTFVVFLAQLAGNGGAGAWPIGVSGVVTMFVAFLSYQKRADISVTKTDWIFFIAALSALPFWYLTSDPLSAVIILTSVDLAGFAPTIRKAYVQPFEEKISLFVIITVRNLISIFALYNYSLTTILFPAAVAFVCMVLIVIVVVRRNVVVAT